MIGKILCKLNIHKWFAVKGTTQYEWVSKYEAYEHAEGECARCGKRVPDIRRDFYW